jgi:hypothetical protein
LALNFDGRRNLAAAVAPVVFEEELEDGAVSSHEKMLMLQQQVLNTFMLFTKSETRRSCLVRFQYLESFPQ